MIVQMREAQSSAVTTSGVLSPGRRLFIIRQVRRLKSGELAKLSRVSLSTINEIERYDPVFTKQPIREQLAAALEVDPTAIWPHHHSMRPWWLHRRNQARVFNARAKAEAERPTPVDFLAFCQERDIDVETLRPMLDMTPNEAASYAADCLERYAGVRDGEQLLASFGLEIAPDDSGPG